MYKLSIATHDRHYIPNYFVHVFILRDKNTWNPIKYSWKSYLTFVCAWKCTVEWYTSMCTGVNACVQVVRVLNIFEMCKNKKSTFKACINKSSLLKMTVNTNNWRVSVRYRWTLLLLGRNISKLVHVYRRAYVHPHF